MLPTTRRTTLSRLVLLAALWLPGLAACRAIAGDPNDAAPLAGRILDAAGLSGGVVVHLGCGDGRLTAALHRGPAFLVQGLDTRPEQVEAARAQVRAQGLYGPVSIEAWDGRSLPYIDNLVNLVVLGPGCDVPQAEVSRVLAPGGVAVALDAQSTPRTPAWTKPRPEGLDEWTHFLHGSDNNAVSHDALSASPRHLQWLAEPDGARHHDVLASVSAAVFAAGRMFAIEDQGPAASVLLPARWWLVARDAFNGLLLWKQPIGQWEPHLRKFRSGPTHLPRRLVTDGPRVYVTLGYGAAVTAHDAATGRLLRTYAGTEGADEIVLADGVLYVVRDDGPQTAVWALRAESGAELWHKQADEVAGIATQTLAVGRQVYVQINHEIASWDRATGRQQWRVARGSGRKPAKGEKGVDVGDGSRTPTLVAWQDVVLSAEANELLALDAADGRQLWTAPTGYGYQSPIDVLVADGLVWTGTGMGKVQTMAGRDPRTGEVRRELDTGAIYRTPGMAHHRCYRDKATDRFLVLGRAGIELLDVRSGQSEQNNWVRGVCQYGVVPCNGLIYAPPHACGCYLQAKLNGFYALAPERADDAAGEVPAAASDSRCLRGPAYQALLEAKTGPAAAQGDWPTYRHDAARSGATGVRLSNKLRPAWQTAVGGKPSAPVAAEGKVFVTVPDAHLVCALNAADGKVAWQFTAGGRVDSPPTIDQGRVLFGSADGCVYCLRAADGTLAWRWQAAPQDRRAVVHEQLESVWPLHGSLLVREGQVWCVAGRSSFLDGGIRLARLDAASGKLLGETLLGSRDPQTGKQPPIGTPSLVDATLTDVLSSDGSTVFMRHRAFDAQGQPAAAAPHLFSPLGFLDDTWWARGYFVWDSDFSTGFTGWSRWCVSGNHVPAGQILACSAQTVYGFSRRQYGNQWPVNYSGQDVTEGREYLLFAVAKNSAPEADEAPSPAKPGAKRKVRARKPASKSDGPLPYLWSHAAPLKVRALVLAGDVLLAAGPPELGPDDQDPLATWEGRQGGVLAAFAAHDGQAQGQWKLESLPVWDGMAVAEGRLLLSTGDGQVRCFTAGE